MGSDYTKDLNRYKYVTRKVYDRHCDIAKQMSQQDRRVIRQLRTRIDEIDEFLSNGPHAAAWRLWKGMKDQNDPGVD